jgi:hypothetical protein
MKKRKKEYLAAKAAWVETKDRFLAEASSSPTCFADADSEGLPRLDLAY